MAMLKLKHIQVALLLWFYSCSSPRIKTLSVPFPRERNISISIPSNGAKKDVVPKDFPS